METFYKANPQHSRDRIVPMPKHQAMKMYKEEETKRHISLNSALVKGE
jgi:hypothetical protein